MQVLWGEGRRLVPVAAQALRSGLLVPSPQSPSALAGWGNHVSPSLPWFGRSLPVLDSPHRCFTGTFFFFKSCLRTELRCGPRSDRKSGERGRRRPFLAQVTPAAGGDTLSRGVKARHQPAHSSRCWFLPRQPQGTPPCLVWPQGAWRCSLCSARTPLPGEHAGAGSSRWQAAWFDTREGRRFLFKQLQRQTWLLCQACGSTHFLTLPTSSWQLRLAPGFLLPSRTCSLAENISSFCYLRARLSGQPWAALGTTGQRADLGWGWGSW